MENQWNRSLVFETCSGPWIVRPNEQRLCRPGRTIDPLFVPDEHWESVDRFEATGRTVCARLASGKWVSAVLAPVSLAAPVALARHERAGDSVSISGHA